MARGDMAYVRSAYGVPAYRGRRVRFREHHRLRAELGAILSAPNARLRVRLDSGATVLVHPTWEVVYVDRSPSTR